MGRGARHNTTAAAAVDVRAVLDARRNSAQPHRARLAELRVTFRDDMTNAELADRSLALVDAHPHWLVAELEVALYRDGLRDACAYLWAARHATPDQRQVRFVAAQRLQSELDRLDLNDEEVAALYAAGRDDLVKQALAHPRAVKAPSEYTMLANERARSLRLGSITPDKDWDRPYRDLDAVRLGRDAREIADRLGSEEIRDLRGQLTIPGDDGPLRAKLQQARELGASQAPTGAVTVDAEFVAELRRALSEQPPGDFVACAARVFARRAAAAA